MRWGRGDAMAGWAPVAGDSYECVTLGGTAEELMGAVVGYGAAIPPGAGALAPSTIVESSGPLALKRISRSCSLDWMRRPNGVVRIDGSRGRIVPMRRRAVSSSA